jgi:acetolactate synthase-1/2/3 large subunit
VLASESIAQYLVDAGAEVHFGVIGEGNVAIVSSLQERGVIHHYARREDAVVSMADGWYRRTGKLGICSVTHGPGFTNTLTALIEAVKRKSRVLLLAGMTPEDDLRHPQLVQTEALVRASGAGWRRIRGAEYIAEDLAAAVRLIETERRPYVVGVPSEFLYLSTDSLYDRDVLPETLPVAPLHAGIEIGPDPRLIEQAAGLLAESRRPLILAGLGAFEAGARSDLEELANALGAPLATTLVAKGMFDGSPWALGVSGGFGTRFAADALQQADLVLAFGASLNTWTTMHGTLYEKAKVIQFDQDPSAFGQWHPVDLPILADARLSAARLVAECAAHGIGEREWGFGPSGLTAPAPSSEAREGLLPRPLDVAVAIAPLLPHGATLAFDAGHCVMDSVMHWQATSPAHFIFAVHSASIGLGLGTAIGASVADTSQWTVFVTGDGGLLMSLQELDTVRRLKLPMITLVLDDSAAGAEIHYCRVRGLPTEIAYTDSPDFTAVAESFAFEAHSVSTVEELVRVFTSAVEGPKRPVMITVHIDSEDMNDWYSSFSAGIEPVRGWGGA